MKGRFDYKSQGSFHFISFYIDIFKLFSIIPLFWINYNCMEKYILFFFTLVNFISITWKSKILFMGFCNYFFQVFQVQIFVFSCEKIVGRLDLGGAITFYFIFFFILNCRRETVILRYLMMLIRPAC